MKTLNQTLSVAISLALAVTAAPWQTYAAETAAMPEFVKTFTPPTRLGYVTNSFKGANPNPIILIQDLHANLGVQKKIVQLLSFIRTNAGLGNKTMVVGKEGSWGDVNVGYLHQQEPKVRQLAADALLKEAEITASEHFAATSDAPVRIVGVDDQEDYTLHLNLIRESVKARLTLAAKVQSVTEKLENAKAHAPKALQKIWKAEKSYENGETGLDELARKLHVPSINSYNEVETLLLSRKMEIASAEKNSDYLKNLVAVDHYMSLLTRLFRQQMTVEEVRFTAQHVDEALAVVQAVLPGENIGEWQETIRMAVDYYAIALMRDKPMAENSAALATANSDQPVAVITGGFHSAGIEKILASKNISFITIAPVVESHTAKDEMLYLTRILGQHATGDDILADVRSLRIVSNVVNESTPLDPAAPGQAAKDAVDAAKNPEPGKLPDDALFNPLRGIPVLPAQREPVTDDEQKALNNMLTVALSAGGYVRSDATAALQEKGQNGSFTIEYGDTPHDFGAYTYFNDDGSTRIVVNRKLRGRAYNEVMSAVAKEAAVLIAPRGEGNSLLLYVKIIMGTIGLKAAGAAAAVFSGGEPSAFVTFFNDLDARLGHARNATNAVLNNLAFVREATERLIAAGAAQFGDVVDFATARADDATIRSVLAGTYVLNRLTATGTIIQRGVGVVKVGVSLALSRIAKPQTIARVKATTADELINEAA